MPSSVRQRAERHLRLLTIVSKLLAALLGDAGRDSGQADALGAVHTHVTQLRRLDSGFSRELLLRLCSKCAGSEFCKGKRRAALLDACDAAAAGAWAGTVTRPAEADSPLLFFARVTAALRMGRRFGVKRVLELRQADLTIS